MFNATILMHFGQAGVALLKYVSRQRSHGRQLQHKGAQNMAQQNCTHIVDILLSNPVIIIQNAVYHTLTTLKGKDGRDAEELALSIYSRQRFTGKICDL